MRELNKLSVVHFKGSTQLTQFSLSEHKLYRAAPYLGPLYRSYSMVQILNCKIPERVLPRENGWFSSMEQYEKGFQSFHAGEDVRPVTFCKFYFSRLSLALIRNNLTTIFMTAR